MKILYYFILASFLLITSCSGSNKWFRSGETRKKPEGISIKRTLMPATPIKEVEEKLVANDEKAADTHKYFVIIGSFRISGNARKYQSQIVKDGFASEILKNEAGLYRVSVKATDDITEARDEVRR
ncbi:MAG: SPOR domain-containing protein, partial [Bacteroidota bacterium]|nr:SPOR domain-containing protein [Bacteroidota bacterium]